MAASRVPIIVESHKSLIFFTSFHDRAFFLFGGLPVSRLIPRNTLVTLSVLTGLSNPDARCIAVMDVQRLDMVDMDSCDSAIAVKYNTTVSGSAGSSAMPCWRQNRKKCSQSASYAVRVASEMEARENRSASFSSSSISSLVIS
jgi:hypothetical protein